VPGAPGERQICELISCFLKPCGLEVEIREPQPGRTSVLARLRGTGGGRSLMLNGHIDTVAAAGMEAVKALAEAGTHLRGDIVLAAVEDEEYGSMGTEDILARTRPTPPSSPSPPPSTCAWPRRATSRWRWRWPAVRRTAANSSWASTPT
jgi:acetylornithine deacetylase/succinyl-diaminopimelate desuccinylase-like protein